MAKKDSPPPAVRPSGPARPVRPIRAPLPGWQRAALAAGPIALLLLAWWLATLGEPEERFVTYQILPSPGEVFASLETVWYDQGLSLAIVQSLQRVLTGLLIGGSIALVLGVLMGAFSTVRAMLDPFLTFLGYIPLPALLPLTLVWLGTDEKQKVGFLAMASLIYAWPLAVRALDEVADVYLQTAYTLGATRAQVIRKVLVPVAAGAIYDAMRLAFGIGWAYVILAETIRNEGDKGIGILIYQAQRRNHPDQVYLLLVVIILLAVGIDKVLAWGGRLMFPSRGAR